MDMGTYSPHLNNETTGLKHHQGLLYHVEIFAVGLNELVNEGWR